MSYLITTITEPLELRRNADYVRSIALTDTNGQPIILDGCSVKAQIRILPDYSSLLLLTLDSTENDDSITIDLALGVVTFQILSAQLQTISSNIKQAYWDVKITWANGKTDIMMEGPVTIKPGVTL